MANDTKEQKVLEVFKIPYTENRFKVLSFILSKGESPFSTSEVVEEMKRLHHSKMTQSSVANILRLFTVRGILVNVDPEKTMMRGRPQTLFVHSSKVW